MYEGPGRSPGPSTRVNVHPLLEWRRSEGPEGPRPPGRMAFGGGCGSRHQEVPPHVANAPLACIHRRSSTFCTDGPTVPRPEGPTPCRSPSLPLGRSPAEPQEEGGCNPGPRSGRSLEQERFHPRDVGVRLQDPSQRQVELIQRRQTLIAAPGRYPWRSASTAARPAITKVGTNPRKASGSAGAARGRVRIQGRTSPVTVYRDVDQEDVVGTVPRDCGRIAGGSVGLRRVESPRTCSTRSCRPSTDPARRCPRRTRRSS